MKKPHEQEWTLDRHMVVNEDGKGVCRMQGSGATTEAEALILAAPDMARALMAQGTMSDGFPRAEAGWHTHGCDTARMEYGAPRCIDACGKARAALRNAGVLP